MPLCTSPRNVFYLPPPTINKYESEGLIHDFSKGSSKYYLDTVFNVVFYATCVEVWFIPRPSIQMKCAEQVTMQVEEAILIFPSPSFVHFQCLHTQPNKISVPAKARDTPVHLSSSYKYLIWR